MCTSTTAILGALLLAASTVKADSWGPAWSLGPSHGEAAIIQATTHLQPGAVPSPSYDGLFLWPGTSNTTSGLIQASCNSLASQGYCGARADQWCCGASYFGRINGQLSQWPGKFVPVEATDILTIDYKLQSDQITWTQTVTVNGTVISTLDSYDGPLLHGGFGTGTECQRNCQGSVATQHYTDTTVVLSSADTEFGSTLGVGVGVVASSLYTPDGGITWKVDSINIPPMTIDANLNPVTHIESSISTKASSTTSSTTETTTTSNASVPTQTKYGQCGGQGWTGPTKCDCETTCTYNNDWYSQCL